MDLRQLKANVISYSTTMNACRGHWQKSLALFVARGKKFMGPGISGWFQTGFHGEFLKGFLNGMLL